MKIHRAAVKGDDGVAYLGYRHDVIIRHIQAIGKASNITNDDLGFVDENYYFYDRAKAGEIAFAAKQTDKLCELLFSEDLWDKNGIPRVLGIPYDPLT